jgi:hypothetical protein
MVPALALSRALSRLPVKSGEEAEGYRKRKKHYY